MVNWKDEMVVYHTARAYVLLGHALFGVYLWEFVTTLKHDWELVTGERRMKLASYVYLLARYMALASLSMGIAITNLTTEPKVDCQTLNYVAHTLAFGSVCVTTGLLYLRVCAVSSSFVPVVVGLGIAYLGYWTVVIYAITQLDAQYAPVLFLCSSSNLTPRTTIYQFCYEVACLLLMIWYLLRMSSSRQTGVFGLASVGKKRTLWTVLMQQGLIYFIAIFVGYLFALVLVLLDLNPALSEVGQLIAYISIIISGTRMQRSLQQYVYAPTSTFVTAGVTTGSGDPRTNFSAGLRLNRPGLGSNEGRDQKVTEHELVKFP